MIVRKISKDEIKRVAELSALAFEYRMTDPQKTSQELYEQVMKSPESRQDLNWQSQWAAFEDDDKTMLGTLTVIPYPANFDGQEMIMMGIGGVATLPQHRRRGGIRACFEKALPDMYEQGATFSYLYPFSTAYYRKFGYEQGCEHYRCKLLLSGMPKIPSSGTCQLLEPGVDLKADFKQVYQSWQNKYNLMTIDEDIEYLWMDKANPFSDQEYSYLYKSADGTPKGFVSFKLVLEDGVRNMHCSRFFFTDLQGFYGLLNLLLSLASDHMYVIFMLPTDVELVPLLPEWSMGIASRQLECFGMVRVVNVEKALHMARTRGNGSLVLNIHDEHIAQNNGSFEVVFVDNVVTDVRASDNQADVSMSIQDFSRLIVGRYDVEALPYLPDVKMNCPLEKIAQVFYRKPLHITRPF